MIGRRRYDYGGRRALVTGASSGLGEAYARALAARGMDLMLAARRRGRLESLASSIEARHGVAVGVVAADLARRDGPGLAWEEAVRHGRIHLLVNNAGFGALGPVRGIPLDRQMDMARVNALAVLELARRALAHMGESEQGGAILNVASTAAFQPVPGMAVYGASKAFVLSLSEALRIELRGGPIRILAVCPGRMPTAFQSRAGTSEVRRGRPGILGPDEVAESSLRALERGRHLVVPGWSNRLGTLASRVVPRTWTARAVGWGVRRFGSA